MNDLLQDQKIHIGTKSRRGIYLLLLFALALGITSCSPPRRLAKEFVDQDDQISMLLMPTDVVYKLNRKEKQYDLSDTLTSTEKDSVLFYRSDYLQNISDSVFLEIYLNSFIDGLYKYGFEVYTPDYMDSFLRKDSMAYILSVAQIELEEYTRTETAEAYFNNEFFYKEFDLKAVNINTWFELSKVNSDENQVLYASHYVTDEMDGYYREIYGGKHQFVYDIDTMPVEAVYQLGKYLGKKYADYLYDYLMNQYVNDNLPPDIRPLYLYTYDPLKDKIRISWERKGFVELD